MYKKIALKEMQTEDFIRENEKTGEICIVKSRLRDIEPIAVGKGMFTKVNANIGTSKEIDSLEDEIIKLELAVKSGADAVMDLSTGKNIDYVRSKILEKCKVPLGTVPVYQLMAEALENKKKIDKITEKDFFESVEKHANQGVDFVTVHTGINRKTLQILKKSPRLISVVSRGGSFILEWMKKTGQENPFFEYFDELIKISKKYDMALSLGDGMRPGCLNDSTDNAQIDELQNICLQAKKCVSKQAKVFIEGPGHVPLNEIEINVKLQKKLSGKVPFYVLGPLVTDIAPGYDHITGAIGGAIAAAAGADFLCYVTPAEHLRLPSLEDVKTGVISAKIAAHAADIVKRGEAALKRDREFSEFRRDFDWKKQKIYSIDPEMFDKYVDSKISDNNTPCTLCGEYCAMKEKFNE